MVKRRKHACTHQGSLRMYANILLSTDGSEAARKGIKHGIALAKALDAKVTVITVSEPLPTPVGAGTAAPAPSQIGRYDAARREHAGKVFDETRDIAEQAGITPELLHVSHLHPATAILETAKSRGCDLIVMGSSGRRGLSKLFVGCQTSAVLTDGSVPVLVVH